MQNPAPEPSDSSGEDGRYEVSDSDPACASLELEEVGSSESLHLELWDSDTDERSGGLNFIRIEDGTSYNDLKGYACHSLGFQHRLNAADSAVFNLFSYGALPVQCESDFDNYRGPLNYPCIWYGGRSNSGVVHSECRDDIREPLLDPDFAFLAYIENGEFHLEDCRRGGKDDCVRTVDRIWPPVPGEKGSCPENNVPDPIWLPRPRPPVNVRIQSEAVRVESGDSSPFIEKITVSWELGEGADYTVIDVGRHGEEIEGFKVIEETEYTLLARNGDLVSFHLIAFDGEPEHVGEAPYYHILREDYEFGNRNLLLSYTAGNPGRVTGFVERCTSRLFRPDLRCEDETGKPRQFHNRNLPFPPVERVE